MKKVKVEEESQTKNMGAVDFREFVRGRLSERVRNFGLAYVTALLEEEMVALCGDPCERKRDRLAHRGGSQRGWIVFDDQRMAITRPRARRGGREVVLDRYEALQLMANLREIVERTMLAGISTRGYQSILRGGEDALGLSRSSVSREFVAASRESLNELNSRTFPESEFWAVFMDGIAFGGSILVVALGVDCHGDKHVLGVSEGSTESHEVALAVLRGCEERGIRFAKRVLVIQDGSKGIEKAARMFFGKRCVVQLCYLHKMKNILAKLPRNHHSEFVRRYQQAYAANGIEDASRNMQALLGWLQAISHSAAESLREGMENLLTLHRIAMPPALRKSFYTTNCIDSSFSQPRARLNRVKRVRGSTDQALRWVGAHLLEQEKKFRKVNSYALVGAFVEEFTNNTEALDTQKTA
jgi:transposase-like protein